MGHPRWVATMGALACFGGGCLGRDEATERIEEPGPILRVDIELDAGAVTIAGAAGAGASGSVSTRWAHEAPDVVHYVEDDVLHVLVRCEPFAAPCLVDVTLTVPADANVTVVTGLGDVLVRGVAGDVEVVSADGAIEGHALGGAFFAETEAGDIVADGLGGTLVDARTGAGLVDLRLAAAPMRLVARTESGDVLLQVPAGPYRIDADVPKGELDIGAAIVEDPSSPSVVVAESGNGDVVIRAREGGR
jgi:hypothetical protein